MSIKCLCMSNLNIHYVVYPRQFFRPCALTWTLYRFLDLTATSGDLTYALVIIKCFNEQTNRHMDRQIDV